MLNKIQWGVFNILPFILIKQIQHLQFKLDVWTCVHYIYIYWFVKKPWFMNIMIFNNYMCGIWWSNDTMTFDHHLMFYMNTHVSNITKAIVIFNAKFGCCANECLFTWFIIVSQYIIRRHLPLDGHHSLF